MGSKNKLRRFKENETFLNLIQPTREELLSDFNLKGNWKDEFKNDNPIVLELGCGKGEYTLALAQEFPNINVIGIDIKGARLWRGAKTALETGLENVRFLRAQIELLPQVFNTSEISEIWITFPDPQIKYKRQKHRLVNLKFLKMYKALLKEDGLIHLKTDSEFLHGYTLGLLQGLEKEIVYSNHDIYRLEGSPQIVTSIQTFYEKQYLESFKPITYLQFRL
ncbi:MAG: tRNA (guanosine(46)-N7)-methyltransferase TrmB [Flavobacteriaceae bacterium]|nr:tRNA (guanosine(46)-N7)-methyltransferase TrmB [Flavobacteriaceae bacterium]